MRFFDDYHAALVERGDEFAWRTQGQNRGFALYLSGDVEGAVEVYRGSWDALREAGERGFRSTLGGLFALALVEAGRREEAEAIVEESVAISSDDDWLTVACVDLVRARFATLDGRHEDAVAAGRHAVELADEGYFMMRPWFKTELGRALAAAGRDDEAREVLEEAIRIARVKGSTRFELRGAQLLDELAD
jgi:tetratricopeptide (TPR) repeat protein